MAGDRAVVGLGRTPADRDGVLDLGAPSAGDGVMDVPAGGPARPQMLGQLLASTPRAWMNSDL